MIFRTGKKRTGTNKRARELVVMVRVSKAEHQIMEQKAQACSLTIPEYLRQLSAGYQPVSTLDQQAISELAKLRADLGRLGGLLKNIFADKYDEPFNITQLIDEIKKLMLY